MDSEEITSEEITIYSCYNVITRIITSNFNMGVPLHKMYVGVVVGFSKALK